MAVIGTGTEVDPYIVNNWTDFCSVKDKTGKYIFWEDLPTDQKIVDLNEEVPSGYSSAFTFESKQIDFNGWTIRNLSIYVPGAWESAIHMPANGLTAVIKNVKLLNCDFTAKSPISHNSYKSSRVYIYDSIITGAWNSTSDSTSDSHYDDKPCLFRCSVNLNVNVAAGGKGYWTFTPVQSIMRFNILSQKRGSGPHITLKSQGDGYTIEHDNKFIINITTPNVTEKATTTVMRIIDIHNSVYVVTSDARCEYGETSGSSKNNYVSLVRSDNVNDIYNVALFKSVTDEQLKDPDYLYSLGFPIATGVGS